VRNTVAILTAACLLIQLIPVAPPRMFENLGFVDTALRYGQSVYGVAGSGFADQLSAMPSVHVAWAVLEAVFVIQISPSRWRGLVLVHTTLTILIVTVTANHWWLDGIVAAILLAAVAANVIGNLMFPAVLDTLPVIGLAVWIVIFVTAPLRRPDWTVLPGTFRGTIFLLALVLSASLMPVEALPAASWPTALGLGFLSSVFDNIPLTALALRQGGYDWGFLAYSVGFGGSMIWFGSSAGVALSNMYPEAKSVGLWLRHGWPVAVAYVVGFFVMLALLGWRPDG